MIRLDQIAGAGDLTVTFPAYAVTSEDGARLVPSMTLAPPSIATQTAAYAMARHRIPARNEGESEVEFGTRQRAMLDELLPGFAVRALDMKSAISGLAQYLVSAYHCAALIKSWEGFGNEDGEAEPELGNILVAMRNPYVATRFNEVVDVAVGAVSDEGNA